MVQLTPEQRVFVVTKFLENKSLLATQVAFSEAFPNRNPPAKTTIWANVKKYREHATSLNRNKGHSGRRRTARTEDNIGAVQQQLLEHPRGTSSRRNGLGLSHSSFNRITKLDLNFHPYRMHIRHQLLPADLRRRRIFAEWLLERCQRDGRFLERLTIGDEAGFSMNGEVNTRNIVEYAPKRHPPAFNFERNISQQKTTVWIGLCGNGVIIGPFFFERNVNGQAYLLMINQNVVPALQQHFENDVIFQRLWWAQDGAPAHRLVAVRNRLQDLFGNRVIALNHAVEWPPRSPDLTPCDFFLWGYLKNKVYNSPPLNLQELRARIQHEVDILRRDPAMVRRAVAEMHRRCRLCIARRGGHVEGVGA